LYYRVVERRLREHAGGWAALFAASSSRSHASEHTATRAYVSESDPTVLLLVEAWAAPGLRAAAGAATRELFRGLAEETVSISQARWFRPWRWMERVGERSELRVAVFQRVAPEDVDAHLGWLRRMQDEVFARGLTVGQTALLDEQDPGLIVELADYRRAADRATALALVAADPPPARLLSSEVFVGRLTSR
jgi:hypothetical protein